MKKKYILLAVLIVVTAVAVGLAIRYGKHKTTIVDYASNGPATIDQLKADLDQATQYELANGCVQPDSNGQPMLCGASRDRVDQLTAKYQNALIESMKPTAEKMETEKASVRKFMGDPSLDLIYRTTDKNATNLTVGKVTKLNSGGWQMDTPKEWERPVDIYQQTSYMDNRCEVYEYELDSRNGQVVEVRIVYPQALQGQDLMAAEIGTKCGTLPTLETPLKTKDQIEQEAFKYLGRNNSDILIKSDIQFVYTPSTKTPKNAPAFNEWKWQDKSYKLPEGLTADVEPYPTVRIIMSSNGRLVNYFNSRGLFN